MGGNPHLLLLKPCSMTHHRLKAPSTIVETISMRSGTMPLFQSSMAHNAVDEGSSGPSHGQYTKLSLRHLQGWRMAVSLCAAATGVVLFLNIILTLASIHCGVSGGVATV